MHSNAEDPPSVLLGKGLQSAWEKEPPLERAVLDAVSLGESQILVKGRRYKKYHENKPG